MAVGVADGVAATSVWSLAGSFVDREARTVRIARTVTFLVDTRGQVLTSRGIGKKLTRQSQR